MSGMVFERDFSSSISASQRICDFAPLAPFKIFKSPRYTEIPPPLLIDFMRTVELVSGAACMTFAPVS